MSQLDHEFDLVAGVWRMLGKRWTVQILENLSAKGMARFGELKRDTGISGTMLSERLLELEREGLVARNIVPPNVEYTLTGSAKELLAILGRWGAKQGLEIRLAATQPTNNR